MILIANQVDMLVLDIGIYTPDRTGAIIPDFISIKIVHIRLTTIGTSLNTNILLFIGLNLY